MTTFDVAVERKRSLGNWQHELIRVTVRGIPKGATVMEVQELADEADIATAIVRDTVDQRLANAMRTPEINHEALEPAELDQTVTPTLLAGPAVATTEPDGLWCPACGAETEDGACPTCTAKALVTEATTQPVAPAAVPEKGYIPADDEIDLPNKLCAFGIEINAPPLEWFTPGHPITEINQESGDAGGQLKALNTVLGVEGFKNGDRHWASLALLQELFQGVARSQVNSLRDLTKGEAHALLNWFGACTPNARAELHAAASRLKGQIPLPVTVEEPAREDPAPSWTDLPAQLEAIGKADQAATALEAGLDEFIAEIEPGALDTDPPIPHGPDYCPFTAPGDDAFEFGKDQKAAIDRILSAEPGEVVFLTGEAGSGKSTVVNYIRGCRSCINLAPTGLAAINVGGETIHRFFRFGIGLKTRADVRRLDDRKTEIVRRCEYIVIDEISMVRADMLDAVDACLRKTMEDDRPFGGKKIILVGDMWQLEPVVETKPGKDGGPSVADWLKARYTSPFWFDAHAFAGDPKALVSLTPAKAVTVELKEVFRQKDPEMIAALNWLRVGDIRCLDYFNKRVLDAPADTLSLTMTNRRASETNEKRLASLPGDTWVHHAVVSGDWDQKDLDQIPSPQILNLKVGARVMFTRNSQMQGDMSRIPECTDGTSVVNGDIGTVEAFDESGNPGIRLDDGRFCYCERLTWEKRVHAIDMETDKVTTIVDGEYSQYPLKLAWAITTHKSQGQTMDAARIELECQSFAHGLLYVALSRVRTIDGLYLRRRLTPKDIVIADRVKEFFGVLSAAPQLNMEALD